MTNICQLCEGVWQKYSTDTLAERLAKEEEEDLLRKDLSCMPHP